MSLQAEAGSFRDREGRVFYRGGEVYRALSERAFKDWQAVESRPFFVEAMASGKIVATEIGELPDDLDKGALEWVAALKHQKIPFISYPYEWSFSMLQDAALLQLDLLDRALAEKFVLKDSSSYNVQWIGSSPIFIDIPSFQPLGKGEPWIGYLQFCELFLYPLLLTAYKDVPYQPWLRGSINGIQPEVMNALCSKRDLLRAGVFTHVYLQTKLQGMTSDSQSSVRGDLKKSGFKRELIVTNVRGLKKLVSGLRWQKSKSEWSSYMETHSYDDDDHGRKKDFVSRAARRKPRQLVWDIGCNTGAFSMIAAEHAEHVVAIDSDHLAVDRLYRELKRRGDKKILPLVGNLADLSPGLGWRGRERKALTDRSRPDLILALALIHHIVIGANVPLVEFIGWLATLTDELVIEFVSKDDPMVKKLLLNKEDHYADYELDVFEKTLSKYFVIHEKLDLESGTRFLYHAGISDA